MPGSKAEVACQHLPRKFPRQKPRGITFEKVSISQNKVLLEFKDIYIYKEGLWNAPDLIIMQG